MTMSAQEQNVILVISGTLLIGFVVRWKWSTPRPFLLYVVEFFYMLAGFWLGIGSGLFEGYKIYREAYHNFRLTAHVDWSVYDQPAISDSKVIEENHPDFQYQTSN